MSRLEASKVIVAEMISFLEGNGVVPSTIHVSDFRPNYTTDDADLFRAAVSWLVSESVVRLRGDPIPDTEDDTSHYEVVLTSFGFSALMRQLAGDLTLRDQLRQARDGQRSWSGVGDLLGGVLGGFTKSIGNG